MGEPQSTPLTVNPENQGEAAAAQGAGAEDRVLRATWQRAVDAGLWPADAPVPVLAETRPWPVVLLTAFGAWLAAVPLMAMLAMALVPLWDTKGGVYLVGVLALGGAMVVLRARAALFVEQLAVPLLLVGLGFLGYGLYRDVETRSASCVLALVAWGCGWVSNRRWLQGLWGALGTLGLGLCGSDLSGDVWGGRGGVWSWWATTHALLVLMLLLAWGTRHSRRFSARLESLSAGGWCVVVVTLALQAGMTFLVGGLMGEYRGEGALEASHRGVVMALRLESFGSALLAVVACGLLAVRWPVLRAPQRWPGGAVLVGVLAVLAFFMSTLGGVLLALAVLLVQRRWALAGLAAVAAVWIVGAFYYALAWPLADKAQLMVGAGVVIGAVAVLMARAAPNAAVAPAAEPAAVRPAVARATAAAVGLTVLASTLVVGVGLWQKEQLIAHGEPVFVALAPVDPRSLMQGDYMQLNFSLPAEVQEVRPSAWLGAQRPQVVALRDERQVAQLLRRARPGETLAPGEFRIELAPQAGHWMLVTDAWYFREGDGERWAQARFGEFRVLPDGRALLVGLADAQLKPISPLD